MSDPLLIEQVGSFDAIREEWVALAESAGQAFGTPEWLESWWRSYGGDRPLLLHACRDASARLVAVLPLYLWRGRPRVIRFLGHGPGDDLGPVVAAEHIPATADALRRVLAGLAFDVFLGEQLPGEQGWPELLGMGLWRTEASPRLKTPDGGWDAYLGGRSANFRQQLARREREVEAAGKAVFRLADGESLERDLDTLFSLHRARWGRVETDFGDTPFQRDVARQAAASGGLRLWLLEVDEQPVAAWHGFHVGRVTSYYQAGRDPSVRLSAGIVLLAHTIRAAMAEGAAEYRFGRGGESFKFRFTAEDPGLVSVVVASGTVGCGALAGARLARSARKWLRRTLGRSGATGVRTSVRRGAAEREGPAYEPRGEDPDERE